MSEFFPYRFDSFSVGIGVQRSKQSQKFSPLRKLLLIFKAHSFPIKISDFKTETKLVDQGHAQILYAHRQVCPETYKRFSS